MTKNKILKAFALNWNKTFNLTYNIASSNMYNESKRKWDWSRFKAQSLTQAFCPLEQYFSHQATRYFGVYPPSKVLTWST